MRALTWFVFPLLLLSLAQSPADVARQAVTEWLSGKLSANPYEALGQSPERALEILEKAMAFPPPPPGLEVNLEAPEVEPRADGAVVKFPAAWDDHGGSVVVEVRGDEARSIFWRPDGGLLPKWLVTPWMGPLFLLLSLTFVLSLTRGRLRGWWRALVFELSNRRRLFFFTNAVLFSTFILGALGAYGDPKVALLVQRLVGGALNQIGLDRAVEYGPLTLAAVIFYWNFTRGLILTTLSPALLFGIPALVLNLARYYVLGIALSPAVIPWERFLLHLPVILLELGGYNAVVFGGLGLLGDVLAGKGYRQGLWVLLRSFVLGAVLLLFAAWYEAFEVMP